MAVCQPPEYLHELRIDLMFIAVCELLDEFVVPISDRKPVDVKRRLSPGHPEQLELPPRKYGPSIQLGGGPGHPWQRLVTGPRAVRTGRQNSSERGAYATL